MVQSPKAPSVKVIDMARNADRDRFEVPRASYLRDGTLRLGVADKPSLRVIRWDFEAAKQHQNELLDARMHSTPGGRRHDAYYAYLNNRRISEAANGHEVVLSRATERCRRTQRPTHLATSTDNFLVWRCDDRPSTPSPTAATQGMRDFDQARPSTAPPATSLSPSVTSPCPTSWNMWNQAAFAPSSPRFHARSTFEYKRCTTPDADDIKKASYARIAAQRSAGKAELQEKEARLAAEWPHGMPNGARRQAQAEGVPAPVRLNHGSPFSLPQREYEALKSNMKWY